MKTNSQLGINSRDPIAIIGAACRLPSAPSLSDFWHLLLSGEQAHNNTAEEQSRSNQNDTPSKFISGIDAFDANFFGMSPAGALRLDPEIRLLLETVWDALEDAGLAATTITGSQTGVYTSILPSNYWELLKSAGILDLHSIMGSGCMEVAAGRISYEFDLRGTSIDIDATCASSLLAVHLACRALWTEEIEMAIVGSANLLLDPQVSGKLSEAGLLSRSGQCRFADVSGDGYVRSEGTAAVILKPCRQAVLDGDRILAVILGSSSTHDGRSGRTQFAPGLASQEQMLRLAYSDAGIPPEEVDYVEAHGTGTPAGDPIELAALHRVMLEGRNVDEPCIIGSAKSNIGHCEVTAGLAGLLKAAMAIHHQKIPATLSVVNPHPVVGQSAGLMVLPKTTMDWPRRLRKRVAGVSAFGVSGANVHAVLSEPPAVHVPRADPKLSSWVLPISARDPDALRELARRYCDRMRDVRSPADLHNLCFSAGVRRTHHDWRMAAVGSSAEAMAGSLRAFAEGAPHRRSITVGHSAAPGQPRIVFVFPGQGVTWRPGRTNPLRAFPAFERRMRECDEALRAEMGHTATERIESGEPLFRTMDLHPVMWAVQVSLAALLEDLGIRPDLVVGHSMGEVAAATAAGALTLRDAAALICRRSRLLDTLSGRGAMWVAHIDEEAARHAIEHERTVSVGVINTMHSVVLAGDNRGTQRAADALLAQGVVCKRLPVDAATHAPLVEELRPALVEELCELRPADGRVPIMSTVTAGLIRGADLTSEYWMRNLRSPVRFAHAIKKIVAGSEMDHGAGPTVFIELSHWPTLQWAIKDIVGSLNAWADCVPSLDDSNDEVASIFECLGDAYTLGCTPDWSKLYEDGRYIPLPPYPWSRRSFWPVPVTHVTHAPSDPVETWRPGAPTGAPRKEYGGQSFSREIPVEQFTDYLITQVSALLQLSDSNIAQSDSLVDIGLDSLRQLELSARIRQDFGIQAPAVVFLVQGTLADAIDKWYQLLRLDSRPVARMAHSHG